MTWVWVFYYGEYNTYLSIGEFIRSYFKNVSFLLIWDKNFRSHTELQNLSGYIPEKNNIKKNPVEQGTPDLQLSGFC